MARNLRLARPLLAAVAAAAILAAARPEAVAKTSRRASYSYDRVWPASVRFLRVDQGLHIIEKDADAGYVLFAVEEEDETFRGALELLRREDKAGREAVEILIHIENRPSYMEHALLDKLLQKLRKELGLPRAPDRRPKPDRKPKDDDEGENEGGRDESDEGEKDRRSA